MWVKLVEWVAGLFGNHRPLGRRGGDSRVRGRCRLKTRFRVGKMSMRVVRSRWINWTDWVLWSYMLFWWAGREGSRCLGDWCCCGCRIVRYMIILRVIRTCWMFGWRSSSSSSCCFSSRGWSWSHCRVVERVIGTRLILRRSNR